MEFNPNEIDEYEGLKNKKSNVIIIKFKIVGHKVREIDITGNIEPLLNMPKVFRGIIIKEIDDAITKANEDA